MRIRLSSAFVFTLCLLALAIPSAHAQAQDPSRQSQAAWLSRQLHQPVQASQILLAPEAAELDGCTIARTRRAPTGATALSLRCPAPSLRRLVLLDLNLGGSPHPPSVGARETQHTAITSRTLPSPNIVRAGAALRADWRTAFIHAQLPVVALDSGAAGAEIRVHIPQTNRIVRARILSAKAVSIISPGA